jgi:hypothetical protein
LSWESGLMCNIIVTAQFLRNDEEENHARLASLR